MRRIVAMPALALALSAAQTARADVRIASETINASSPQARASTLYIAADRLKLESGPGEIIYRSDTGVVYNVMTDRQQYMALDPAAQQHMAAMVSAMREQLRQRLASLPEDQRKQIEATAGMAGSELALAPVAPFVKTGESKTVGSWSCQVFRKSLPDGLTLDECFAPLDRIGLKPADLATLKSLVERMRAATLNVGRQSGLDILASSEELGFEGFPIETVTSLDGSVRSTSTVTSIAHLALPPATFEVPAGYALQEMPAFGK